MVRYNIIFVCTMRKAVSLSQCCSISCILYRPFVQELDLPIEQLSLLDRSCHATKNRTHVVFRTALDQCQTRKITVDDEDVYSNAVSSVVVVYCIIDRLLTWCSPTPTPELQRKGQNLCCQAPWKNKQKRNL